MNALVSWLLRPKREIAEIQPSTIGSSQTDEAGAISGTNKAAKLGIPYLDLARLVILVALGLVLLTFRDYGITNDEEVQKIYGQMILAYYTSGFHDLSALTYKDLYYYGGLFDVVAAFINQFSPLGEYETRHLLGGLVGVLGLTGTWKLARLLARERTGFLAVCLLAMTPAYYGPQRFGANLSVVKNLRPSEQRAESTQSARTIN